MKRLSTIVLTAAVSITAYELLRRSGLLDETIGKVKVKTGELAHDTKMKAEGWVKVGEGKAKQWFNKGKAELEEVTEAFEDAVELDS